MPRTILNCTKCRKEIPARETKYGLAHKTQALVPANRTGTGKNEVVNRYFHAGCPPPDKNTIFAVN